MRRATISSSTLRLSLIALILIASPLLAGDCNQNNMEDGLESLPVHPGFVVSGTIESDDYVTRVWMADLDGDGDEDFLASSFSELYPFFRIRDGGGPFREGEEINVNAQSVASTDVDGDGNNDLLIGLWTATEALVLVKSQGGVLAPPVHYPVAGPLEQVIAADFDSDGAPDVAAVVPGVGLVLLWNDGDGMFGEPARIAAEDRPRSAAATDVDGDGDLDLVVLSDVLRIHENDGAGGFSAGSSREVGIRLGDGYGDNIQLLTADFDQDGTPDFAISSFESNDIAVLLGAGNLPPALLSIGSSPIALAAADLNGDGLLDLAATTVAGVVPLLYESDGTWSRPPGSIIGVRLANTVPVELDADSPLELVAVVQDGRLLTLRAAQLALSLDRNQNGLPDDCDLISATADEPLDPRLLAAGEDCNHNGSEDGVDIADGASLDANRNVVPDECELAHPFTLRFQAPEAVAARAGSVARIPVVVQMLAAPGAPQLNGWSLLIGAEGCSITRLSTEGTLAAHSPEGLWQDGDFLVLRFVESGCDVNVYSAAAFLDQEGATHRAFDPVDGRYDLLRFEVEAEVSAREAVRCRLHLVPGPCDVRFVKAEGDGGGATGKDTWVFSEALRNYSTPVLEERTITIVPVVRSFRRADANDDGRVNISDPIRILARLFAGGPALGCQSAADANDDGDVDISDAIHVLDGLFLQGLSIPAPGPARCGEDPTRDALPCDAYQSCDR